MEEKRAVLVEKLDNELEKYKAKLLEEKPEVIYENSYKTTCMQEIKNDNNNVVIKYLISRGIDVEITKVKLH